MQLYQAVFSHSFQHYCVVDHHYYGTRTLVHRPPWISASYNKNFVERSLGCVHGVRMQQELVEFNTTELGSLWRLYVDYFKAKIHSPTCMCLFL